MRARHRHLTIHNNGASACWDARTLSGADGSSVTSWVDVCGALSAGRASNAPVLKLAIQGGQQIVRFQNTTFSLDTASNSITQNKGAVTIVSVAAVVTANSNNYQQIARSRAGAANDRVGLYLRQSKAEAGGRRLDADSYQFVQSSSTFSNSQFVVASAEWRFSDAELTSLLNGSGTSRSGGFQTAGNSSNTSSIIEIGGTNDSQRLIGDVGMIAFFDAYNPPRRRRFEHAAAYSFKISCN